MDEMADKESPYHNPDPGFNAFYGNDVNPRRIALLEAISKSGSISAAAKQLGMSYRSAWDAVNDMNNLWDSPLVLKTPGGARGGGTLVTPEGHDLIARFKLIQQEYLRVSEGLKCSFGDFNQFQLKISRLSMRTSARNQFQGRVDQISVGPVNAEIMLAINQRDHLTATVTRESVDHLGLTIGSDAYALIKASFIILARADEACVTSARNQLCGTVDELRHGPVNCEVIVTLDAGKTLASIITEESAQRLELQEGSPVCALFKSSHVIVGVN